MWRREREKKEERPISFTPSPENLEFLKTLREAKDSAEVYHHCKRCHEGQPHFCHLFYNGVRSEWLEWGNEQISISFKKENHIVTWYWQFDEEASLASLKKVEAVLLFEPPFLSELNSLAGEELDRQTQANLSLAETSHALISFSADNLGALSEYQKLIFQTPAAQKALFAELLTNFKIQKEEGWCSTSP